MVTKYLGDQPCERCGTKRESENDGYRIVRPGSKADALGYHFERVCAKCLGNVPAGH